MYRIRPVNRRNYIDKVMTRLTLAGAYITFICLIPEFMMIAWNVRFYFGGILAIVVVVIMTWLKLDTFMSQQYDSVLKKANLKGYGR